MNSPPETSESRTFLAVTLFLVSLLLFALMGLVIKRLSPDYGAAELSSYRNLFAMIPAIIVLWATRSWHAAGRPLRIRQWRLGFLRGAIVVFAQVCYYISLTVLPFATATTISYSMALFMVALAVPILGEKVGVVRWCAVLIGFLGVLMVLGLGREAFTWVVILPVAAAVAYALTGVLAPLIDKDVPTPLMNMYSNIVSATGAMILVLALGGYSPIQSVQDFGWIALMGSCGGTAVLLMVFSYRMAEQSDLAPFNYFGIPLAFVLGWYFYDEAPWRDLFPGAILIVFGGLLIVWRERRLKAAV